MMTTAGVNGNFKIAMGQVLHTKRAERADSPAWFS